MGKIPETFLKEVREMDGEEFTDFITKLMIRAPVLANQILLEL